MRISKILFSLLLLATLVFAADPMVGTWVLNAAKTKYTTGAPPKGATITVSEAGTNIDLVVKGTTSDGKAYNAHYTVPAGGGVGKVIEANPATYDGVSGKRTSDTDRETTFMKGGKSLYTAHTMVAMDGKSMSVMVKGTNVAGQNVEGTAFYDKK